MKRTSNADAATSSINSGPSAQHGCSAQHLANVFSVYLNDQRSRVSGPSRLGEKLVYFANPWDGLLAFLHDRRVEDIDALRDGCVVAR